MQHAFAIKISMKIDVHITVLCNFKYGNKDKKKIHILYSSIHTEWNIILFAIK